jgi:uncharacterized protein YigE (DUF2233 family)
MELFHTTEDGTESIQIYRISQGSLKIDLCNDSSHPEYICKWPLKLSSSDLKPSIIINGTYFHDDYSPAGYLKINKNRVGERIFAQNESGLIQIENNLLSIRDLSKDPLKAGEEVEFGMQSYPFLIKNSVRALKEDSGKKARRTVIGIDDNNYIYIILVDDHHMSLYELMVELVKSDIPFKHVLNLDGGTSSGIFIDYNGYREIRDSIIKVPNVIIFTAF